MCKRQFPENLLSSRIRAWNFRANEEDPKSAAAIAAAGEASASTSRAAAAVVVTDLEKKLDPATAAKAKAKRIP